jgi:MraZ protein
MFIGEYQHNIDLKKRLALPSKFRKYLGENVVITKGLDKCLFVYGMEAWKEIAEKLSSFPVGESATRSFVRMMLSGATDVEVDGQGRVLLPEYLKEYAMLDKNVIVVGLYNRLEIWDENKWQEYRKKAEENTDEVAENLGKLGIY